MKSTCQNFWRAAQFNASALTRRVDFLPLLKGAKREELKDMNNFIQFGLNHWTLEWYNGIDFAPDYLYKQGTVVS